MYTVVFCSRVVLLRPCLVVMRWDCCQKNQRKHIQYRETARLQNNDTADGNEDKNHTLNVN